MTKVRVKGRWAGELKARGTMSAGSIFVIINTIGGQGGGGGEEGRGWNVR